MRPQRQNKNANHYSYFPSPFLCMSRFISLAALGCKIPPHRKFERKVVSPTRKSREATVSDEQQIWGLDNAYWRYVQENNLPAFLNLLHKDFLGWPSIYPGPVRKDHMTEWITAQTTKGLAFKQLALTRLGIEITEDVAVTCYSITYAWQDKNGDGTPIPLRMTHVWTRSGDDWQMIGGMSMPEPPAPPQ